MEKYCKPGQATDGNTAHAHCMRRITKAIDTNPERVILIAYPLQQRLQERASMLRYT